MSRSAHHIGGAHKNFVKRVPKTLILGSKMFGITITIVSSVLALKIMISSQLKKLLDYKSENHIYLKKKETSVSSLLLLEKSL